MTVPDPERARILLDRITADLAELRALHAPPSPVREEEFLDTAVLAELLQLSRSQVVRLCEEGVEFGIAGIEKRGRPWFATLAAVRQMRAIKARR